MSAVLSLTEAQTLKATGDVLLQYLLADTRVIRGQVNRTAPPMGNFIVMTPVSRVRLATNVSGYTDTAAYQLLQTSSGLVITTNTGEPLQVSPRPPGTMDMMQSTQLRIQLDLHGPNSGDNTQIVETIMRDPDASRAFAETGYDVRPLYADEARQMAFPSGENQNEDRWVMDLFLHVQPVVMVPMSFAERITAGILNVDVVYPPVGA